VVLRLLGVPVASITVEDFRVEYEEDDGSSFIGGGSAHDFERDVNPVAPEDRYNWEWDDKRRFGFGAH